MIVDLTEPMPVVDHPKNPVYVLHWYPKWVMLRIGGYGQGEGRRVILSPKNARVLAAAILEAAERAESQDNRN